MMKRSAIVFLVMCSVVLLACQLQYLVSGQPASATDVPVKARATLTTNPGATNSGQNDPMSATVTAKSDLVVRTTASTVAPSVGQLNKGEVAQVMARTSANDWFQVGVFSGISMLQGWVPANQVTVEGSLDKVPVVQPGSTTPPPASVSSKGVPPPANPPYPVSSQKTVPTPTRKTYP
jgi:uncharacterized protein YgiM (DUF1202 family)